MIDNEIQYKYTCEHRQIQPCRKGLVDTTRNVRHELRLGTSHQAVPSQAESKQAHRSKRYRSFHQIHLFHFLVPVTEDLDQRNAERRTINHNLHHQVQDNGKDQGRYSTDRNDHRPHRRRRFRLLSSRRHVSASNTHAPPSTRQMMICKYDIVIILLLAEQIKCLIIWKEHHEAWGILCTASISNA